MRSHDVNDIDIWDVISELSSNNFSKMDLQFVLLKYFFHSTQKATICKYQRAIKPDWFVYFVGFYGISILVGYLRPIHVYTNMICKQVDGFGFHFLITFLNEPELVLFFFFSFFGILLNSFKYFWHELSYLQLITCYNTVKWFGFFV